MKHYVSEDKFRFRTGRERNKGSHLSFEDDFGTETKQKPIVAFIDLEKQFDRVN